MIGGKIFLLERTSTLGEYRVIVQGIDNESNDFCYVYVNFYNNEPGYEVFYVPKVGDSIWWQNSFVYWTKQDSKEEIRLNRIGLSCPFKKD